MIDSTSGYRLSFREEELVAQATGILEPLRHGFWRRAAPWLVLLASLLVTAGVWRFTRDETTRQAQERFDFQVEQIQAAIHDRLLDGEHLLRGLLATADEVPREEWRTYVKTLRMEQQYPGIQGFGFVQRILPAEKAAHIRQIRGHGFPQYTLWPEGKRPEYTAIIFLETVAGSNQRALGYDMFSEPVRQQAMMRARDTGLAAMSGKVALVQETDQGVQVGFLLYLPVYRRGAAAETPAQRQEALIGYIYSPFQMDDFMGGILRQERGYVDLEVFDGEVLRQDALLYRGGTEEEFLSLVDRPPFATRQSIFEFGGHRWLLEFTSSPYSDAGIDTAKATAVLVLGLLVSLLLFGLVLSRVRARRRAIGLDPMGVDLEKTDGALPAGVVARQLTAPLLMNVPKIRGRRATI